VKLSALGLLLTLSSPALAAAPRVDALLGAPSDAYDAALVDGSSWIATSGGLVIERDGHVTRTLTALDGLPGNRLRSISVLPDGVYVGGVEGAARLDQSGRVIERLAIRRVRRVVQFGGARYLGVFGGGVVRSEPDGKWTQVSGIDARATVTDLLASSDHLYVATAGRGIVRLDAHGNVDATFRQKQGLRDDVVWDLALVGEQVVAATARGLATLKAERADTGPSGVPSGDTRAVEVVAGKLRVALWGRGVYEGQRLLAPLGEVRSLSGELVLHAAGAERLGPTGHGSRLPLNGLPTSDVTSLALGEDALWIGTFNAGLLRRDADGGISSVEGIDRRVNDVLLLDRATQTLVVATDAGLYQVAHGRGSVVPGAPREHTSALFRDARTGAVWVAGAHTLARLEHGSWTRWQNQDDPALAQLDSVTVDARGQVWAGGLSGLLRFDPRAGRAEVLRSTTGTLGVDWVTACVPWQGGLAVGTYNGGLSLLGTGGQPRLERESDGLPSGWVNPHALSVVRGELWFGALEGGLVYGRPGSWSRLSIDAGLPSDDVTAVAPIDAASAWIATRGGIAHVVW
jgi:ligand-binding sensor domain-containing protein